MLRLVLLLLIVAGVAGYFTRPEEAAMRSAADAVLQDGVAEAAGNLDVGGALNNAVALAGDRAYSNYYVGAKYDVTLDGQPIVSCIGAFTQVQCTRQEDTRTGG